MIPGKRRISCHFTGPPSSFMFAKNTEVGVCEIMTKALDFDNASLIGDIVHPIKETLAKPNPFVIISKTPTSVFLANINDEGGPVKWQEMRRLPGIIEIHRDSIDQIVYTQTAITNLSRF